MKKTIELLAPVGSMESLHAAVQNGANAVYLGGKLFSARAYASNFDYEQLKEAISYAHLRNVLVYVTANILIDDSEMEQIIDYIKFLYEIDVDGIIIQDLGLANVVSRIFPKLDIHGSTQMTINNLSGAKFLKDMGFTRVVLARETPIDEIKYISKNTPIELEAFIHGALCMCYSGQCLMSSMIGGRSGNRGTCAQPCRMPYSIIDKNENLLENYQKTYALSTKDLNTLDNVKELLDSGIISLKIEGRMKRPEYVATVVKAYNNAINKVLTDQDKKDVEQIFNRGFTKGLTFGDFGRSFVSNDRPDNRGILLGKVIRVDKYKVYIQLVKDIEQGDGLEFMLSDGEYKGIKAPFDAKAGSTFYIEKTGNILKDSNVYKTSSNALLKEAKSSYINNDMKFPIDMEIKINLYQKPKLKIIYKNHKVEVVGDLAVEKSQKISITEEKVLEQLSKLGDTTYYIKNFNIELDDNAYLPVSTLNQLRREAIDELNIKVQDYHNREIISNNEFKDLKDRYLSVNRQKGVEDRKLSIRVSNLEQYNQLDLNKVDRLYLGFYHELERVIEEIRRSGKEVFIWTDKILYEKDLNRIDKAIEPFIDYIDGISVSNIGSMKYFQDRYDLKIHTDIGLNAFNSYTLNYLRDMGIDSMTLSPELNLQQIKNISSKIGGKLEGIVYGYLPVMITKNCPMALVKGCTDDSNCKKCNFSKGYGLKDRMGVTFRMERKEGFSTIYNSYPLMVLDNLDQVFNAGINMARLDFTSEIKDIRLLQRMYYDYTHKLVDYKSVKEFVDNYKLDNNITNGHYFRGVVSVR